MVNDFFATPFTNFVYFMPGSARIMFGAIRTEMTEQIFLAPRIFFEKNLCKVDRPCDVVYLS